MGEKQLKQAFKMRQLIQCPLSCSYVLVAIREMMWDCSSAKEQGAFVNFAAHIYKTPCFYN